MNENEIINKLQEIFQDVFGDKKLTIDKNTNPNTIDGWDSLTQITILESVQDEFDLKFSLEEMIKLNDVGKIVDAIMGKN